MSGIEILFVMLEAGRKTGEGGMVAEAMTARVVQPVKACFVFDVRNRECVGRSVMSYCPSCCRDVIVNIP